MSIDVVEVVIWRESSVSGGSGAVQMFRSEERFSRNAETDLVCRLLLEKKKLLQTLRRHLQRLHIQRSVDFNRVVIMVAGFDVDLERCVDRTIFLVRTSRY